MSHIYDGKVIIPVGNHIHTDVADDTTRVNEVRIGVVVVAAVRRVIKQKRHNDT